jgi:cellulose synthase/poly-beta-1,6-N-acetylglucosamine synthase-like glycosyltransferase
MLVYFFLTLVILFSYVYFQLIFVQGWRKMPEYQPLIRSPFTAKVSVLIAARNEEKRIGACIQSLLAQDYPADLLEIIILDNHSTDHTVEVARSFSSERLNVIRLADWLVEAKTFKKETLDFGIAKATGEIILTTDADTEVPAGWVSTMVAYMEQNQLVVCTGPVRLDSISSFIERYQSLDLAGLMVVTGGGQYFNKLISANGANFGFKKAIFYQVGGYNDNLQVASGDDLFLIQKINEQTPDRVGYLKSKQAVVTSRALKTFASFWAQRKRWASKSSGLPHRPTKRISILTFLNSVMLGMHVLLMVIYGLPFLKLFIIHFLAKSLADYRVLREGNKYLEQKFTYPEWILAFFFNPFYIVYTGFSTLRPGYIWKDRSVLK